MFGSTILDVGIGLVFIYLILSLICTYINEMIATAMKLRAKTLEDAISSILNNQDLVKNIYDHSIIQGLSRSGKAPRFIGCLEYSKPSYISSENMALAFLDIIKKQCPNDQPNESSTLAGVLACAEKLPDGDLKNAIFSIAQKSENDINQLRSGLENWFDDSMDRVSGWYKKQLQIIGISVALFVSVAMNADTIGLANRIYNDGIFRSTIVATAENANYRNNQSDLAIESSKSKAENNDDKTLKDKSNVIRILGWDKVPMKFNDWVEKIIGLLLTTFAISLGAPFWFDVLSKFMNIRMAGDKPKKAMDCKEE